MRLVPGAGRRRQSDASQRDHEAAEALSAALDDRYTVVAYRCGGEAVPEAAVSWLRAEERVGKAQLLLQDGLLMLVGLPVPALDWSWSTMDAFCASIAAVAA
jgi:hypothetical protein